MVIKHIPNIARYGSCHLIQTDANKFTTWFFIFSLSRERSLVITERRSVCMTTALYINPEREREVIYSYATDNKATELTIISDDDTDSSVSPYYRWVFDIFLIFWSYILWLLVLHLFFFFSLSCYFSVHLRFNFLRLGYLHKFNLKQLA
jgi:hypothetical protein